MRDLGRGQVDLGAWEDRMRVYVNGIRSWVLEELDGKSRVRCTARWLIGDWVIATRGIFMILGWRRLKYGVLIWFRIVVLVLV